MMAGNLNKPILIKHTCETVSTGTGSEIDFKAENINTRAEVKWGSGRRETVNQQIVYSYDATFIVWDYLEPKIMEGDHLFFRSKEYMIVAMERVAESKMLYLRCETL